MESYNRLALVYDRLMDHLDFKGITAFYLEAARRFGWQGRDILDLACGTGNISLELLKQGYQVCGLDRSADMLAVADQKLFAAGFTPDLICLDMSAMKVLNRRFDMVVCALDSLNYILKKKELEKAFTGVSALLPEGGFFLFDVHSEYKFQEVMGSNAFTYQDEDICYIWQNRFNRKSAICGMSLDIFAGRPDGLYERISEYHEERCYSCRELECALHRNGFEVVAIYGDWKHRRPGPQTERLVFVTRKVKQ